MRPDYGRRWRWRPGALQDDLGVLQLATTNTGGMRPAEGTRCGSRPSALADAGGGGGNRLEAMATAGVARARARPRPEQACKNSRTSALNPQKIARKQAPPRARTWTKLGASGEGFGDEGELEAREPIHGADPPSPTPSPARPIRSNIGSRGGNIGRPLARDFEALLGDTPIALGTPTPT